MGCIAKGDILDGSGSRANVREITNWKIEKGFGRFLTFLMAAGIPWSAVGDSKTVSREVVRNYVEELRRLHNSPTTILSRLQELHDALSAIHPERNWSHVKAAQQNVRSRGPWIDKKRAKMVAADDLFGLGTELMEKADGRSSARLKAIDFRDGLLIALLSLRPLRLHNLAMLKIGLSLVACGNNYRIVFDGCAMKNGSPFEACWPESLLDHLRCWLETHRPVLLRCRGRWAQPVDGGLWVSSHGSPMTKQAVYDRVCARTRMEFGHSINPHLFRDVAATTLAIEDPKHVRLAAPLLSHRDFGVTERHYLQARMLSATGRYQAELCKRRSKG